MHEFISGIIRVVILTSKAEIWGLPHPDRKWVDTCNKYPLSNIELLAQND